MSHNLGILLLFVGFIGTAFAFGGDAWRKGRAPLIERISWRGWISITCAAIALILGSWKEIDEKREAGRKEHEAKIVEDLKEKVAQQDKDFLNAQLKAARDETKGVQTTLDQANESLSFLRSSLSETQKTVDTQGLMGLENSLATNGRKIVEVDVILPLSAGVKWGNTLGSVLLPRFSDPRCSIFDFDVDVDLPDEYAIHGVRIDGKSNVEKMYKQDFYVGGSHDVLRMMALFHPAGKSPSGRNRAEILDKQSEVQQDFGAIGIMYGFNMKTNQEAIYIALDVDVQDIPAHKWIDTIVNVLDPVKMRVNFPATAPPYCYKQVNEYLRHAFKNGMMGIVMNGDVLPITFRITVDPKSDLGNVAFKLSSQPTVFNFKKVFSVDWEKALNYYTPVHPPPPTPPPTSVN